MFDTHQLRAAFARSLSAMYGTEVPAYNTLVDVSTAVNTDFVAAHPDTAERLGRIDRVTAERHGAIRVGTASELRRVAQIFAALGMEPVGFYDLRGDEATSLPIVSTAFRPTTLRRWRSTRSASSAPRSLPTTAATSTPASPTSWTRSSPPASCSATTSSPSPRGRRPRVGCRTPRPRSSCGPRRPASSSPTIRSTAPGTPGSARSRASRPTSAASGPRTSTTSRRACSTSTICMPA